MYFITTKRMLEVCFSAHPNIQYRPAFLFVRKILLCRIHFLCFISVFHFCVSFLPSVLDGV